MTNLLQEVEGFIEAKFGPDNHKGISKYILGDLSSIIPDMRDNFNLTFIGCGISRSVFKQKYSRSVIKIGIPSHNKGEYSLSEASKGTNIETVLANCKGISTNGRVLEQEYVHKTLIELNKPTNESLVFEDIFKFRACLNKKGFCPVYDLHDSNIGMKSNGDLKIIDYSMFTPYWCIDSIKKHIVKLHKFIKKNIKSKVELFIDVEGRIILKDSDTLLDLTYEENEPSLEKSMG